MTATAKHQKQTSTGSSQKKLNELVAELDALFLERTDLIKLLLTAYIAKANLYIGGKPGCQPAGSKVLMRDGRWKNVEDVKLGDLVMSPQHDGSVLPKRVIDTFAYDNYPIYRITTRDRERLSYLCSGNHILPLVALKTGPRPKRSQYSVLEEMSVEQFLDKSQKFQKKARIFTTTAYDLPEKNYAIHPYVMGCLLGNGSVTGKQSTGSFSHPKVEVIEKMESFGAMFGKKTWERNTWTMNLVKEFGQLVKNSEIYGTNSHTKFIPDEYLLGSLEQRLWLIAGLIDTDGAETVFASTSLQLAKSFEALMFSVGGYATVKSAVTDGYGKNCQHFRVYYSISEHPIPLQCSYKSKTAWTPDKRSHRNHTFSVEYVRQDRVYGFLLEPCSQWYVTDNYLVTHNTGKTMLAKAVAQAFDTRSFYYLVSATTQVDELLGSVDLAALQNSEFKRDLTGKLADCELAIIDEIFKAPSPTLNALLGIILDHEVPNGKHVHKCPLISLVGCSNELPQEETLAPFWDRFTLRYWVEDVNHKNKKILLQRAARLQPTPTVTVQFALADLEQMHQEAIALPVTDDAIEGILHISKRLAGEGVHASTRKHVQMIGLLRAYAYVCGAKEVTEEHLDVLKHIFWNDLKDREKINDTVKEVIEGPLQRINHIMGAAQTVINKIRELDMSDTIRYKAYLGGADSKLTEMIAELERVIVNAPANSSKRKIAQKAHAQIMEWRKERVLDAMTQLEFGI